MEFLPLEILISKGSKKIKKKAMKPPKRSDIIIFLDEGVGAGYFLFKTTDIYYL